MLVQIPSKVVQASAKKIVQKSGATIDIQRVRTVEEWIPETEMGPKKLINLRTAAETGMVGEIKLKQFNPSFFLLGTNIYCRASGCSTEVPRSKPSSGSQDFKQDLFLCKAHRTKMRNLVSERCKQEKIHSISTAFRHEDFAGYTNVIGVLEKAYIDISKRNIATCEKKNLRLAEVFLNARNFLIITNALLNPNDDNAQEALPAVFALLEGIMDNLDQPNFMERLVSLVKPKYGSAGLGLYIRMGRKFIIYIGTRKIILTGHFKLGMRELSLNGCGLRVSLHDKAFFRLYRDEKTIISQDSRGERVA